MTFPAKHELVRTIQEMARNRKVEFDNSGAFLFNQTHLNAGQIVDILRVATEGMVTIHPDRADLAKYSVISDVHDLEIVLDADIRTNLCVRALLPLDYQR